MKIKEKKIKEKKRNKITLLLSNGILKSLRLEVPFKTKETITMRIILDIVGKVSSNEKKKNSRVKNAAQQKAIGYHFGQHLIKKR
ncbi:hypothetical protein GCM10010211_65260 [Streptomyces albospinus]|uniref:Uncharacterized protein n=1 Tax=Streptomyces albospinus TaxID=285515 RepID=A0ABQ2VIR5_9ACTN|nr:hypothetical protein GCM10010211_65260 [Streptomyces albospinus]